MLKVSVVGITKVFEERPRFCWGQPQKTANNTKRQRLQPQEWRCDFTPALQITILFWRSQGRRQGRRQMKWSGRPKLRTVGCVFSFGLQQCWSWSWSYKSVWRASTILLRPTTKDSKQHEPTTTPEWTCECSNQCCLFFCFFFSNHAFVWRRQVEVERWSETVVLNSGQFDVCFVGVSRESGMRIRNARKLLWRTMWSDQDCDGLKTVCEWESVQRERKRNPSSFPILHALMVDACVEWKFLLVLMNAKCVSDLRSLVFHAGKKDRGKTS